MKGLRIESEDDYLGKGWWRWSVWLDGSNEELDGIESVEYVLHPTFPNRFRTRRDRSRNFRLTSRGRGGFTIYARVEHKDETVSELRYPLILKSGSGDSTETATVEEPAVYLSSGIADFDLASTLSEGLVEQGLRVRGSEDVVAGSDMKKTAELSLRTAHRAVFVLSDHPSPFLELEFEQAEEYDIPVTLVVIGTETEVPSSLQQVQSFRFKDFESALDAARDTAKQIADELKGVTFA